jgi:hypothetical protein
MSRSRSTEGESDRRRPPMKVEVARRQADGGSSGAHALRHRLGNEGMRRLLGESGPGGVPAVQAKLTVSKPGDQHEQEADRMADAVMRMPAGGVGVQRMCTDCEAESKVSRAAQGERAPEVSDGASASIGAMRGVGSELPAATRDSFEPRFGADFSKVRVHTDARAADTADALDAKAFTVGNDVAFARGEFAPHSVEGQKLLAHELTHVVQQNGGGATVHRDPKKKKDDPAGKRRPAGGATAYNTISMRFNGTELIVFGDGKEVRRYDASSGRPVMVSEQDARQCGGDVTIDTYMSPMFTGIKDHGPIPEGVFSFDPSRIQDFTEDETSSLLWGGIWGKHSVKVQGQNMHPGDWGAGRVALRPIRMEDGPCGNARARDAFFLHGGMLRGSAGCIDVGDRFPELSKFLSGFGKPVRVEVKYEGRTPRVGFWTGLAGTFAYHHGRHFHHGPSVGVGSEFGGGEAPKLLLSAEYQAMLAWAGGALSAGLHVDIPMKSETDFVRIGMRGGAEFRLLRALYGHLAVGGYYEPAQGNKPANKAFEYGGGLMYDFGPAQLKLTYAHLNVARGLDRDQVLLSLGFRWR